MPITMRSRDESVAYYRSVRGFGRHQVYTLLGQILYFCLSGLASKNFIYVIFVSIPNRFRVYIHVFPFAHFVQIL